MLNEGRIKDGFITPPSRAVEPAPKKENVVKRFGKAAIQTLVASRSWNMLYFPLPTSPQALSEHDQLIAGRNSINSAARHLNQISEELGTNAHFHELPQPQTQEPTK